MKITRSAVYKLSVAADCGCVATGEYTDPLLEHSIGKHFEGCQTHQDSEGIRSILYEVVDKEAHSIDLRVAAAPQAAPQPATVPSVPVRAQQVPQSAVARPAGAESRRPTSPPFRRSAAGHRPQVRALVTAPPVEEDSRVSRLIEVGLLGDEDGETA